MSKKKSLGYYTRTVNSLKIYHNVIKPVVPKKRGMMVVASTPGSSSYDVYRGKNLLESFKSEPDAIKFANGYKLEPTKKQLRKKSTVV